MDYIKFDDVEVSVAKHLMPVKYSKKDVKRLAKLLEDIQDAYDVFPVRSYETI